MNLKYMIMVTKFPFPPLLWKNLFHDSPPPPSVLQLHFADFRNFNSSTWSKMQKVVATLPLKRKAFEFILLKVINR